jgi:hypothetical protein
MVRAADSLGQDLGDVKDVKLVAQASLVLILRYTVGGNQLVDAAVLEAGDSITAENAVSDQGKYGGGTLLLEELGSTDNLVWLVSGRMLQGVAGILTVLPVSIRSSMMMQTRSVTSPTRIMLELWRSVILVGRRSLWMREKPRP